MKINEVEILTVEGGVLKEVKMFGEHFFVYQNNTLNATTTPNGVDKGTRLGMVAHVAIYENIVNEIRNTTTPIQAQEVVRRYYPTYQPISLKTTATCYRRYVREQNGNIVTNITPKLTQIYKQRHRYRKRNVPNSFGFSKTYATWVKNDEVTKVKQAIQTVRFDYKPTNLNICKETNLTKPRVNAVIDVLLHKGIIVKSKDGTTPYYNIPYVPESDVIV